MYWHVVSCLKCGAKRPAPVENLEGESIGVQILRSAGVELSDFDNRDFQAVEDKARELLSPTIAAVARLQAFEDVLERAALCPDWLSWRFAEWAKKQIDACCHHSAPEPPTGLQCEECGEREVAPERVHWARPVCDVCLPPGNRAKERPPEPAKDGQPSEPPPADATDTPALDALLRSVSQGSPADSAQRHCADVRTAYAADLSRATKALRERAEKAERELARIEREHVARRPPGWMTVRDAAKKRYALDGADAQAMEGAISLTERERDEARAKLAEAERFAASEQLERALAERDRDQYREKLAALKAAKPEPGKGLPATGEPIWRRLTEHGWTASHVVQHLSAHVFVDGNDIAHDLADEGNTWRRIPKGEPHT
jgi:hypothetical protein